MIHHVREWMVSMVTGCPLYLENILHQEARCVFKNEVNIYLYNEDTFLKFRGEKSKNKVRWGSASAQTTPCSADSAPPPVSLFLTVWAECWQCWDVMETAGLWNIRTAVYIGPGAVRAAIMLVSGGNRSGLMGLVRYWEWALAVAEWVQCEVS